MMADTISIKENNMKTEINGSAVLALLFHANKNNLSNRVLAYSS
jgi:hypothetical protein